jgi:hypothetical protein
MKLLSLGGLMPSKDNSSKQILSQQFHKIHTNYETSKKASE